MFVTSTGDAHGSNRFEIQLDGAQIIADGEHTLKIYEFETPEPVFTKENTAPFGAPKVIEITPELDGKSEQHNGVIRAFGGAILRGEPLIADGSEGINGLTLSNAMHLSAFLDREISLPFDEELYYTELMKRVATSRRKTGVRSVIADTEGTYGK